MVDVVPPGGFGGGASVPAAFPGGVPELAVSKIGPRTFVGRVARSRSVGGTGGVPEFMTFSLRRSSGLSLPTFGRPGAGTGVGPDPGRTLVSKRWTRTPDLDSLARRPVHVRGVEPSATPRHLPRGQFQATRAIHAVPPSPKRRTFGQCDSASGHPASRQWKAGEVIRRGNLRGAKIPACSHRISGSANQDCCADGSPRGQGIVYIPIFRYWIGLAVHRFPANAGDTAAPGGASPRAGKAWMGGTAWLRWIDNASQRQRGRNIRMTREGRNMGRKSLRAVVGKSPEWKDLAKVCVAFTNADGGALVIGVEDGETGPPEGQKLPEGLRDGIRRTMTELTVGLSVRSEVRTSENGAEYIELHIPPSFGVASTTDGQFFNRIDDQNRPVTGDDVALLVGDRAAAPWESQTSLRIGVSEVDHEKLDGVVQGLRRSEKVSASVKEKTPGELMEHYGLAKDGWLTNLGVLFVGGKPARSELSTAPMVRFFKLDDIGEKVNEISWADHTLNPIELVDAVWRGIPDFREWYEVPNGMRRHRIPAFDENVVREIMVNALVHRSYSRRGDIHLNLHPDRLEVRNPGRLPRGVNPRNVLHKTVRRNTKFAELLHDLGFMERQGSGFDLVYERLLTQGKPAPRIKEDSDSVTVVVPRRIIRVDAYDFISKASEQFKLTQRERIALGLLAQNRELSAGDLMEILQLESVDEVQPWIRRVVDFDLVGTVGEGDAICYYIKTRLL